MLEGVEFVCFEDLYYILTQIDGPKVKLKSDGKRLEITGKIELKDCVFICEGVKAEDLELYANLVED